MNKDSLKIGGRYNWKYQPERLVYLGNNWSGNGYWHQFAKVESPDVVWCEILDSELHLIEETADVQIEDTPGDAGEGNNYWGPPPMQEVFEITPTHRRTVGTIGHVSKNKIGLVTALLSIAGGMGVHPSLLGEREDRETFYDKYEKAKGGCPDDDIAAYNKAEAKRRRKNAKRLNNLNQQARV